VPGLWLSYLALAAGLMTYGGVLIRLGLRRPARPAGPPLRIVMVLALLLAVLGTAAAVIFEAKTAQPW
jgi:hypothetical protein